MTVSPGLVNLIKVRISIVGFVSAFFNVPSMSISPGINPKYFELDPSSHAMNVVMRPKMILVTMDSITFWLPWRILLLLPLFFIRF